MKSGTKNNTTTKGKRNTQAGSSKNTNGGAAKAGDPESRAQRRSQNALAKEKTSRVKDEILAIVIIALGIFFVIFLQTDAAGLVGNAAARFMKGCFGLIAFVFPYYMILYGILLLAKKTTHISVKSVILFLIIFFMIVMINAGRFVDITTFSFAFSNWSKLFAGGVALKNGGLLGMMLSAAVIKVVGIWSLYLFCLVVILICLLL
nr:hypothetical protein [Clostridia bacterium]